MKHYVLMDGEGVQSPSLTLKSLLNEKDFSDKEVDDISFMMAGDTYVPPSHRSLAVKRVGEAL